MDKEQTAIQWLQMAARLSLKNYKQQLMVIYSGGKDKEVFCVILSTKKTIFGRLTRCLKRESGAKLKWERSGKAITKRYGTQRKMYIIGGWKTKYYQVRLTLQTL